MNDQLHTSSIPGELSEIVAPVKNRGFIKPLYGFWTSTYVGNSSEWVDWCRSEDFCNPDKYSWFVLTPHNNVRVYTIATLDDLRYLVAQYPEMDVSTELRSLKFLTFLDFERIAQDYDAIHLTSEGQWAT